MATDQIARIRTYRYTMILMALAVVATIAAVRVITGADRISSPGTLRAAIIAACPILLAGIGGLWAERAGIVNIGLEGQMLLGTWGAAFFAYHHGPYVGLLGAAGMGLLGGLLHAVATVSFGVDHIISGVAINIISLGAIGFLAKSFFEDLEGGGPRNLSGYETLPNITVPGVSDAALSVAERNIFVVSDVAGAVAALTTRVSLLTVLVVVLVVGTAWLLWRTAFGLRLRSCGENPQAAETLGVDVYRYKYVAVMVSGAFAGLGGAYLTMVASSSFTVGQTGGRGYIGLAAMIFGNWRPSGVVAGSLMFGYTDGISLLPNNGPLVRSLLLLIAIFLLAYAVVKYRSTERVTAGVIAAIAVLLLVWFATTDAVPSAFTGMTPYVITLFVLAVAGARLRMPAADGKPYRRGGAG
ncbi:branched-chain amino acid ABC transporter, permease protein [Aeromicrobium marinum DSM 15272]|uniref:Branched-chain amino acid ABC transporter, permease protein n=1 Tax=Aeromicrobium marinum DSM 15272 TaxID=585531 RepID=E2SFT8_9ACTN|nr:ABC transporter permease [Aeromicrobium marinum]EFQ81885.1 branched-chain amino acid ABC transporter, permease protein [Aeromicrobium marinum DSM 15272]